MTGPKLAEHTSSVLRLWKGIQDLKRTSNGFSEGSPATIVLNGNDLTISHLVACARHAATASISTSPDLATRLQRSVDALSTYLDKDRVVYGVNTGFGGSADVRTNELLDLQIGLLQHTQSAIVTSWDKDPASNSEREPGSVMPPEWVRGAMLARANQNLRGHSAVRLEVLENLVNMLEKGLVPMVPLRGTISASGDLMPMSYIAGALTGNPDVFVQVGKGRDMRVIPASEALRESGLSPTGLGPKEGLGLINGTAPSVSLGSLVLYDAQQLAYLSQLCTAFAAEGMGGNVEWASAFIHAIRPHPGQIEAASNIRRALHGSNFVVGLESRVRTGEGLWQDRYSTRTAPQWIGPYLEDLLLAQRQLEIELNSTSDNPLVDANETPGCPPPTGEVYSGGNFQAVAITSAMDKTRLALQMIGRMLFSQVSEMIHPSTNNGLEANLNASDKENFTMKGIDVNMAAYQSELAALAHPVSAHVMSAEMHNQGINSLALISARRTAEAVDLVRRMAACHLYVSSQAVDLRNVQREFLKRLHVDLGRSDGVFGGLELSETQIDELRSRCWHVVESTWCHWNAGSWKDRIDPTVEAIMAPITSWLTEKKPDLRLPELTAIKTRFHDALSRQASETFYPNLATSTASTAVQLGDGTAPLYTHIRKALHIPLHCGLDDDPLYNARHGLPTEDKKTIGSWVGKVYEGLRGDLMDVVMKTAEGSAKVPRSEGEWEGVFGGKTNGVNGRK